MVRAAALVALALSTPAHSQTDSPFLDWVVANSPYGFDLTSDGSIWINIAPVGAQDDYAILADDLNLAREESGTYHQIWVRGYHRKNPNVKYRETKALWAVDCKFKTISRKMWVSYDADRQTMYEAGPSGSQPIVPGSYGAEYYRQICLLR